MCDIFMTIKKLNISPIAAVFVLLINSRYKTEIKAKASNKNIPYK